MQLRIYTQGSVIEGSKTVTMCFLQVHVWRHMMTTRACCVFSACNSHHHCFRVHMTLDVEI
jgi:hypothetical protein